jgi:hypothetical protein
LSISERYMARMHQASALLWQCLRVLTITPSEIRLANMLEVVSEVADGIAQGLFLFTTAQRFATHGPFAS